MCAMSAMAPIAIRDAIDDYLAKCEAEGYSAESVKPYGIALPRLADFATGGGYELIDRIVLPLDCEWQRYLRQEHRKRSGRKPRGDAVKLSPFTINLYSRVLRAFASWLVDYGCLDEHPLAEFKPGRLPKKEVDPLSEDEQSSGCWRRFRSCRAWIT